MKFEIGSTYNAKNNNSFKIRIESRTKCFVKVAILIDGIEDTLFKGSGRHKTQILRGIEYCSTTLHEYYANNKLEESAIA